MEALRGHLQGGRRQAVGADRLDRQAGIVVVESAWKARRRPYHKQKLALLLANQRQFALEQAGRGVAVRFVATDAPFGAALRDVASELGPLRAGRAALLSQSDKFSLTQH